MIRAIVVMALAIAQPAAAQDHSMHDMPGMPMPPAKPVAAPGATPTEKSGTDLPPGDAPAPPAPMTHYADRYWDGRAMARARDIMMRRDGGGRDFTQIRFDIAEYQVRDGDDGYRWEGEGWFGGDVDRLVVKSEGEGSFGERIDAAEVQALYSRAIGPYFNLQAGVRHDVRPTPSRTYAAVSVEGVAPYWFEITAAAFLSTQGEVLARAEGYYDQRLTQRLIVQPRAEIDLSAQDVASLGLGSGVTSAEIGVRLRYEITRQFAPYVGFTWERKLGETARFARASRRDAAGNGLVIGVRGWF